MEIEAKIATLKIQECQAVEEAWTQLQQRTPSQRQLYYEKVIVDALSAAKITGKAQFTKEMARCVALHCIKVIDLTIINDRTAEHLNEPLFRNQEPKNEYCKNVFFTAIHHAFNRFQPSDYCESNVKHQVVFSSTIFDFCLNHLRWNVPDNEYVEFIKFAVRVSENEPKNYDPQTITEFKMLYWVLLRIHGNERWASENEDKLIEAFFPRDETVFTPKHVENFISRFAATDLRTAWDRARKFCLNQMRHRWIWFRPHMDEKTADALVTPHVIAHTNMTQETYIAVTPVDFGFWRITLYNPGTKKTEHHSMRICEDNKNPYPILVINGAGKKFDTMDDLFMHFFPLFAAKPSPNPVEFPLWRPGMVHEVSFYASLEQNHPDTYRLYLSTSDPEGRSMEYFGQTLDSKEFRSSD